jgi:RNA polymerase-binding transcription factor DksA
MMPTERSTAENVPPGGRDGPRWRALLEARWQARLEELTELALAYHAAGDVPGDEPGPQEAQTLLRRAVAARRKLEDVEEALARLAAGSFGRCEQCGSEIPPGLLALIPEARYCPRCDTAPGGPHGEVGPGRAAAAAARSTQ